jgi:hypothetical protein
MKTLQVVCASFLLCAAAFAVEETPTGIHGTITKIDRTAKTIVIKTGEGTEHTLHFVGKTVVHGSEDVAKGTEVGAKDTFHGLKEGSEVVAQYTAKGAEKTAVEVDHVAKDGVKVTEGTVSAIDRGAKTIAVKTADGTVETFKMTDRAAVVGAKDVGKGVEKASKVTVYYTEESGKKIAHFFAGN